MFRFLYELPAPEELRAALPFSEKLKKLKEERARELKAVLGGADKRFILIAGPCFADGDAVPEYAARLAALAAECGDKLFFITRVYTHKPRSRADGFAGYFTAREKGKDADVAEGLFAMRKIHIDTFAAGGLLTADEILYTETYPYIDDVLGYAAVGARGVQDRPRVQFASGIEPPAGLKNPLNGDFVQLVNAVTLAQAEHVIPLFGAAVKTGGNAYAHAVLRGYADEKGVNTANFSEGYLTAYAALYAAARLKNPALIVDVSHGNSNKDYKKEPENALSVLASRAKNPTLKSLVKGVMIESYIEEGAQSPSGAARGQSVVDPCLGWADTEKLIREIYKRLS